MTKGLASSVIRVLVSAPVAFLMMFSKPTKVDADYCAWYCDVRCPGGTCYAYCEGGGGPSSENCVPVDEGEGSYCIFSPPFNCS